VMVTFLVLARPLILRLSGATDVAPKSFRVVSGFAYRKKAGRREYLRARLEPGPEGGWIARKFPRDGAGILSSMVDSDGLLVLDEAATDIAPGASVPFIPFREVID
jgi:molybdopterin molybdotransferase